MRKGDAKPMMYDAGALPNLSDKVAQLSRPATYGPGVTEVIAKETHMSWVFLAGNPPTN